MVRVELREHVAELKQLDGARLLDLLLLRSRNFVEIEDAVVVEVLRVEAAL